MPKRQPPGLRVVARPGTALLYLRGTVRGQRVYESAGTDDRALAEEARAAREAELYRAAVYKTPPRVTFSAAVVSYTESERRPASTLAFLNRILLHFGAVIACQDIDQAAMDRACRALCRPDAKPATKLRNVITPTRAILMHAARRGWCAPPVFEKSRSSPPRTDWLTPSEAEAMIGAATGRRGHLRPLLVFLFCTGARMGETLALRWEDVDLKNARAVLRDTKNGADRIVDLPARAVAELANVAHRDGAVFRNWAARSYRATAASATVPYGGQASRGWAGCLKAAGIGRHLTPHHARHSWASWHYAVHNDMLLLKRDGGWFSASQVERYAKLVPAGMAEDVRRFWGSGAVCEQKAGLERKIA